LFCGIPLWLSTGGKCGGGFVLVASAVSYNMHCCGGV
jgi:hypothetical protein